MKFDIAASHLLLAPLDQHGVGGLSAGAASAPARRGRGAAAVPPPAPSSAVVDMRRATRQISNNFVAESSSGHTYIPKLVLFILWLFDNHQELIEPSLLPQMVQLDNSDQQNYEVLRSQPRRAGAAARALNNRRSNLRSFVKSCIENTPPQEGQTRHSSPIKIDGDGALTHTIIKEYMQTSMKQVWVNRDAAEEYIKAAGIDQTITDDMVNDEGQVSCSVYQSASQYGGIRSSIAYLYKLARVAQPAEMTREMSTFMSGMDRTITSAKEKLGLKISEGKKPMSFEAYSLIAKTMFESGAKEDIFAHTFLVFDWCLMKRAENCVNAKINHIFYRDDCLVFQFAKSKGHQKGEEHVGPWHVYANPDMPWLCPQLALARYLICYPDTLKGGVPLFPGKAKSVYSRYADRFNKTVKALKGQLKPLGYSPGDLGTHSARKGVGSMVAAGCTVSPPIVSLCIRAGWVLGGVKDKYLFRENAGDQYVGRCASCLDQTTKEFAVSPAYFDYSEFDAEDRVAKKKKVKEFIDSRLGFGADALEPAVESLVQLCFATICYHYGKLQTEYLHKDCILRVASLFRGIPEEITRLAVVKYPWNKTSDTPKPTGIPPHVLHLVEMHELKLQMKDLKTSLIEEMKKEMDARGFESKEVNTERILKLIQDQTDALFNKLIEKTDICAKATADATARSINEYQQDFVMEIEEDEELELPDDATAEEIDLAKKRSQQKSASSVAKRRYRVGLVKVSTKKGVASKLAVLPSNFKFPSMTPPQLIENWFIGDLPGNIPPLCTLDANSVSHIAGGGSILRKMKRFMLFVAKMGRQKNLWGQRIVSSPRGWDIAAVKDLWYGIEKDFKTKYMPKGKRKDISWRTPYNSMKGKPV